MSTAKLTTAVEEYFADLRRIRGSGGATGERSYYPALTNLLNAAGSALRPQVFCVGELAEQGAGQWQRPQGDMQDFERPEHHQQGQVSILFQQEVCRSNATNSSIGCQVFELADVVTPIRS